jgi:hypothetical protein
MAALSSSQNRRQGTASHDHEGFGTRSRTKPFMIMTGGREREVSGVTEAAVTAGAAPGGSAVDLACPVLACPVLACPVLA